MLKYEKDILLLWFAIYHAVIFILYRVGRGQADVCVQCLLQIAMKSSPHLDWVVAHIG